MAIQIRQILGTDSISASRITINDNFFILQESINDLLNIIDTTSGAIDNSNYGSLNTIKTRGLTVTGTGIQAQNGNIQITNGDLELNTGEIKLGTNVIKSENGFVKIDRLCVAVLNDESEAGTDIEEGFIFIDKSTGTLKVYLDNQFKTIAFVV